MLTVTVMHTVTQTEFHRPATREWQHVRIDAAVHTFRKMRLRYNSHTGMKQTAVKVIE